MANLAAILEQGGTIAQAVAKVAAGNEVQTANGDQIQEAVGRLNRDG
ncbi:MULTISPECIES: hypothetical protein [unclassified Halorhabdus]|nr:MULTISPECIES: hypothetical protein [unclassified Halorhabdus]